MGTAYAVQQSEGWVWTWVDSLIVSISIYPAADIDEALAAAGRIAQERAGQEN